MEVVEDVRCELHSLEKDKIELAIKTDEAEKKAWMNSPNLRPINTLKLVQKLVQAAFDEGRDYERIF